ncbi:MAG: Ig-like domain-containing protein [Betaproteobacteria bacterium]|nr:Ig-like domain-containing protein [Betaproteobacteria bacterium]
MQTTKSHIPLTLAMLAAALGLAACLSGGAAAPESNKIVPTTATQIILAASPPSIKTDGSNSTTITASVLDANNLPISGQIVKFTAHSGQLGASSGPSSAAGVVTIPFSALATTGGGDRTNRTESITATLVGALVTALIPIQVSGSALTLTASKSIGQVGEALALAATANDAGSVGVGSQTVKFSIDSKSTGAANLSATTATTGANGATSPVTLTGTAPGNVTVNADWLNADGTSTLTASTTIAVTSIGTGFAVTAPATNPTPLSLLTSKTITVSVPQSISGTTVTQVRFATTLGAWTNGGKISVVAPVASVASEALTASTNSGNANIQIDALDSSGNVLATLNRVFALSASTGTQISLQPSVATVAPSTGGTVNSTTLTATVRDNFSNTVGNVPVLFEIVNSTGSGEQISPVVVYTNSNGQAATTFTSGSASTVGGLQIKASVVGATPAVADIKTINVAGASVSVTLGQATAISSTDNGTTYTLPMSVLVVSSTGGAVAGATVTLSAFPSHYYRGKRDLVSPGALFCSPIYSYATQTVPGIVTAGLTYAFPNEDVNENDILDPGEDYDPFGDGRGLGSITPPHATAGTLPPTVVTNASGVGSFNLTYLKNYGNWVETRVRAKVVVNGTEFVNELKFNLPVLSTDATPVCTLPNSPFGP